jgi:hypothetical protein
MRTLPLLALILTALLGSVGCKPELIAGTEIEDSEENRSILTFLTRYQAAMQARKSNDILELCAADYYERNGNDDPNDDYNRDGLKVRLDEHFARTKELVLEMFVQKVEKNDEGYIGVTYRYNTRALVGFPAGDKWLTATEVNKVILRPVADAKDEMHFRFMSGL